MAKLGPHHFLTLQSINELANTWADMGRLTESIDMMKRCVQMQQEVLGPAHQDTVRSVAELVELERMRNSSQSTEQDISCKGGRVGGTDVKEESG